MISCNFWCKAKNDNSLLALNDILPGDISSLPIQLSTTLMVQEDSSVHDLVRGLDQGLILELVQEDHPIHGSGRGINEASDS